MTMINLYAKPQRNFFKAIDKPLIDYTHRSVLEMWDVEQQGLKLPIEKKDM